jgi:uncharacterized membrane protein SpoIIM required for sporulation
MKKATLSGFIATLIIQIILFAFAIILQPKGIFKLLVFAPTILFFGAISIAILSALIYIFRNKEKLTKKTNQDVKEKN